MRPFWVFQPIGKPFKLVSVTLDLLYACLHLESWHALSTGSICHVTYLSGLGHFQSVLGPKDFQSLHSCRTCLQSIQAEWQS